MKILERKEVKLLFGKIAKGTIYENYAINNKIINKNKNFISKKSESAKFSFAFVYNGNVFRRLE